MPVRKGSITIRGMLKLTGNEYMKRPITRMGMIPVAGSTCSYSLARAIMALEHKQSATISIDDVQLKQTADALKERGITITNMVRSSGVSTLLDDSITYPHVTPPPPVALLIANGLMVRNHTLITDPSDRHKGKHKQPWYSKNKW